MPRTIRISRSIRARVTVGALVVTAVVLGIGSIATVQILSRALVEGVAVTIEQDLETLAEQLEHGSESDGLIARIDDDMLVRLSGPTPVANDDEATGLPIVAEDETMRFFVDGEAYLAASEDVDTGVLTVARPLEHVDDAVTTATVLLAVGVPVVLALIGVVVWIVTGRALAPVERLRLQVDGIGASDLGRRVDAGDRKSVV